MTGEGRGIDEGLVSRRVKVKGLDLRAGSFCLRASETRGLLAWGRGYFGSGMRQLIKMCR